MATGIGERIKQKRIELGLSQEELATKMGLKSKSTICKIEKGVDNLTPITIAKYAKALDTTPAVLMGWETHESPEAFDKRWNDITNGQHPIELSDEEYRLIVNYRVCSDETKEMISRMVLYGTEIKKGGSQ